MEAKQELGHNQEKWLQALESGDYKQGMGNLHVVLGYGELFCCLGVACVVSGIKGDPLGEGRTGAYSYDGCISYAPSSVVKALGLHDEYGAIMPASAVAGSYLAGMNDEGKSFAEIAAFIRANPSRVFVEPR
jgi:hypothetical protein